LSNNSTNHHKLAYQKMKTAIIITLQLITIGVVLAQSETRKSSSSSKLQFNFSAQAGKSKFDTNVADAYNGFPTVEVRLGLAGILRLNKHFDLISGVNIGNKIKGERMFPPGSTPGNSLRLPPPYNNLEESVNSQDHYFVEVPLLFQFNLPNPKISFRAGPNYRQFFRTNGYLNSGGRYRHDDMLSSKNEIGVLSGVSVGLGSIFKNLGSRIKLTGTYYVGVSNIYSAYYVGGFNNSGDVGFLVKNRFWQTGLEYYFKR
jgi:hypothetical protein